MFSVQLIQNLILNGAGVALAVEILKSKFIPVPAQHYPRTVAAVVSLGSASVVEYQSGINNFIGWSWTDFTVLAAGTLLVAASIYNHIIKK